MKTVCFVTRIEVVKVHHTELDYRVECLGVFDDKEKAKAAVYSEILTQPEVSDSFDDLEMVEDNYVLSRRYYYFEVPMNQLESRFLNSSYYNVP